MIKRVFDIAAALLLLVSLSPIMLLLAVWVRLSLGSPVLYSQLRPGRAGALFRLYKFRSMLDANDNHGQPLPDAQRLTTFGRRLRSTSLDELPSLWNVLRGEMSLVGPRPLLPDYLPLYSAEQARRHEVRPGITGWAQINGRNAVGWEERFAMDVWYVENQSLRLDLLILLRTVARVIQRDGISSADSVTMTPFTGSSPELTDADERLPAEQQTTDVTLATNTTTAGSRQNSVTG